MSNEKSHNQDSPEEQNKDNTTEFRYIPVEYLPHSNRNEDEIDLIEMGKKIWDDRLKVVKVTVVFLVIGIFIALFSPVEYESEAILMPEIQQQQGQAGRLLQQFGGAFGLGGGNLQTGQEGTIPPLMYPRIVHSLSFQLELMEQEILFADYDITTTIPDFYENYYSLSLTQWIQRLTIRLPHTLLGLFRDDEEQSEVLDQDPFESELIRIPKRQLELIDDIRNRITVSLDEGTGLLTTRVNLHDARASAELNYHLIELLKEYITDYRIEKVRQDLEFVEEQHKRARERFEITQMELAEFMDRNISLSTARAQTELERLQDEKDLAFNVYNSLSQQLEQARLKLQEQTPVFKIVQTVNVPSEKSSPRRGLISLTSFLLGIFFGVTILILKIFLNYHK